ncbi:hypothetical protein [Nocardia brevicatena]|uniref:hypothetical protein n=1 Tax=Nocardia brevicatena TaxID=37327 RepID=UPI00031F8106|nr:hypothetical protein [Nocardia brevicatena]
MVTITNVRLVHNDVEDDTEWELRFDSNGVTDSWPVHPGDDEHVEASLVFSTYLTGIHTGVVERFCFVNPPYKNGGGEAVFGVPEALNRLGAHFGLTFE